MSAEIGAIFHHPNNADTIRANGQTESPRSRIAMRVSITALPTTRKRCRKIAPKKPSPKTAWVAARKYG